MTKVLIGSIIQESNTFSPLRSSMDDFRRHKLRVGDEIFSDQTENELKGFMAEAQKRGAEVLPTISANAVSSGVFRKEALEELKELLRGKLRQHSGYDGVYFALHGAMVAEGCDDVEGELVELIRREIGSVPFVISLDLHANVTKRMVSGVDALVGFRTYPHTDFVQTGQRAASLLFRMLQSGSKLQVCLRKIPMIVPAENCQSDHGPFAALWREAERGEKSGDSLVTSLFPVQPWLDIDEMGCAVVTVGEDSARAEREAERLSELFWKRRHEFQIKLYSVSDVLALLTEREEGSGPLVASDSSDSPSAGSSGDSNAVLRELLKHGAHLRHRCYLTIVDPPAVERAFAAGEGQVLESAIGYSLSADGKPLKVRGTVRRFGDGKFTLQGGYAKGTVADMGRCTVLDIGTISLLVTELPTFSGDPSMYRSVGLEPSEADLVVVKSANQFRAEYEAIASGIFILDTPGRSPANLLKLSFSKLQRPCYPFDDDFDWRRER